MSLRESARRYQALSFLISARRTRNPLWITRALLQTLLVIALGLGLCLACATLVLLAIRKTTG